MVPVCEAPDGGDPKDLDLALLRVSRLVAAEAACQFYSINTFHFCIAEAQMVPYEKCLEEVAAPDVNEADIRW